MTQTKGVVYLAGPIRSNLDGYQREFSIARELIRGAGYTTVDSTFLPLGLKENDYMRISLAVLEAADTVVALKGWTHSQGAQIEWAYAQRTGKRRLTLAQFCEENNILNAPEDTEVGKREKAG